MSITSHMDDASSPVRLWLEESCVGAAQSGCTVGVASREREGRGDMAGDWWQQYIEIARMRKRTAERRQELLPISIEPLAGRATPPHALTGDQFEELVSRSGRNWPLGHRPTVLGR